MSDKKKLSPEELKKSSGGQNAELAKPKKPVVEPAPGAPRADTLGAAELGNVRGGQSAELAKRTRKPASSGGSSENTGGFKPSK